MSAKKFVTVAIVTTLLIGGIAAVGAAAPADAAADDASDAQENGQNETAEVSDRAGDRASASETDSDRTDGIGPADGLPAAVPDHVSEIHDAVESFLRGEGENLGDTLQELRPGSGPVQNAADGSGASEAGA